MSSSPTEITGYGPYDLPLTVNSNQQDRKATLSELVDGWFKALADTIPSPGAHEQVFDWLRMQSRIPYASVRNTILLLLQCPEASMLGSYEWWDQRHSRQIAHNESAIWLFDPIIAPVCPECSTPFYDLPHDDRQSAPPCCSTPPGQWSYAVAETTPTPLFDSSQIRETGTPPHPEAKRSPKATHPPRINPPQVTSDEYAPDLSEDADLTPTPEYLPAYASEKAFSDGVIDAVEFLEATVKVVPAETWSEYSLTRHVKRDPFTLSRTIRAVSPADAPRVGGALLSQLAAVLLEYDVTTMGEMNTLQSDAELVAYAVAVALGHGRQFTASEIDAQPSIGHWGQKSPDEIRQTCVQLHDCIATILSAFTKIRSA